MANQSGVQRRADIMEYLRGHFAGHNYPPSLEEVRAGCGLKSNSTVVHHLAVLEKEGVIERWQGMGRTLRLVEVWQERAGETTVDLACPPDGHRRPVPGIIVGRGLAVITLPNPDEDGAYGYSVTHIATGRRIGDGAFWSQALALRCTRELIRVCSFEQSTLEEATRALGEIWDGSLKPIVSRYLRLDEQGCDRETAGE